MPTKLQTQALEVLKRFPVDADGNGKIYAIRELRNATDMQYQMREYVEAIEWARAYQSAADLPVGSIVATDDTAFIKNTPALIAKWSTTNGRVFSDATIDSFLASGAHVLRVGTGEVK